MLDLYLKPKLSPEQQAFVYNVLSDQDKHIQFYYRREVKKDGRVKMRPIYAPSDDYKLIQDIFRTQLKDIFPIHPTAYAWREGIGRVECAMNHIGKKYVAELDIKDFFGHIRVHHLRNLFKKHGVTEVCGIPAHDVIQFLTIPVKNNPMDRYLAMGFTTSPDLANAVRYDCDVEAYEYCQANNITFSTYGDNIFMSGDRVMPDQCADVARFYEAEGFPIPAQKRRISPYYRRQAILGIVINKKLSLPKEYTKDLIAYAKSGRKPDLKFWGRLNTLRLADNHRDYKYILKTLTTNNRWAVWLYKLRRMKNRLWNKLKINILKKMVARFVRQKSIRALFQKT